MSRVLELMPGGKIPLLLPEVNEVVLEEFLGGGGYGMVWKASDPRTGRRYALKILQGLRGVDIERARREADVRIPSPHIIPVIGLCEWNPSTFLILFDFFDGKDLGGVLSEGIPDGAKLRILSDIAEALASAHSCNIVHRDLKPENVLIGKDREVRLIDFGTSKFKGAGLTVDGDFVGTIQYTAPDIFMTGSKNADAKADIYSLGIIIYEVCTGRRLWEERNWQDLSDLASFLSRKPPPQSIIEEPFECSFLPNAFEIARRATAVDPEKRFARVDDIVLEMGHAPRTLMPVRDARTKYPKLTVETGSNANSQTVLAIGEGETVVLGREDIAGSDVTISRRQRGGHVEFRRSGDHYEVRDAGSTVGTMLRGSCLPFDGPFIEICDGDRLKVGDVFMRFELVDLEELGSVGDRGVRTAVR